MLYETGHQTPVIRNLNKLSLNRIPFISGTVSNEGCLTTGTIGLSGKKGVAQIETLLIPPISHSFLNYGQDSVFNKVALRYVENSLRNEFFELVELDNIKKQELLNKLFISRFYNHSAGETVFEQEKPAIDFYTDVTFLSADQKTVELMSQHTNDVYNFYLTQPTNHSVIGIVTIIKICIKLKTTYVVCLNGSIVVKI